MELEELKKSWNALDEHLKDKKFVNDDDISRLIQHADNGIHAIAKFSAKLILLSLLVIGLALVDVLVSGKFNIIYSILFIIVIPALCWDLFTIRFIQRTRVDEMPLIEVINRVNRIQRWMINERFIGIGFILAMAVFSFINWQIWQFGFIMIVFFILLWGGGIFVIIWLYRHKFLSRIQEIKKNLNELKELTHS